MLCKKCKTAVADDAKRCSYCGTRLNRGRRLKMMMKTMAAGAVIAACGVLIFLNQSGIWVPGANTEPDDLPAASGSIVLGSPAPSANASLPTASNVVSDMQAMLEAAYKGAMLYTAMYDADMPFVSQNGYLYNAKADVNAYVTVKTLVDAGMMEKRYENEKVLLLYLRPIDMKGFAEVQTGDGTALTVFAACETKDGIAILGGGTANGTLYRESMGVLLAQYAVSEAEIERPRASDATYKAVLSAIREEAPSRTGYDVRYMASDGQYAFAVVSERGAPETLAFHIVEKTERGWQLRPPGVGVHTHYAAAANLTAPNMNIQLLPDYAPADVHLLSQDLLVSITADLLADDIIAVADMPASFMSGNGNWVYMVLKSGRCVVGGYNSDTGWDMEFVQDWLEAEDYMREKRAESSAYIIWQE